LVPDRTPSPSRTAYKRRTTGTLSVAVDHAEFRPKQGASVRISDAHSVAKGWKKQRRGKWLPWVADSYIEVVWSDPADESVAYFNDCRWLGLGVYLPHRRYSGR
jgi:hypothetical protein